MMKHRASKKIQIGDIHAFKKMLSDAIRQDQIVKNGDKATNASYFTQHDSFYFCMLGSNNKTEQAES